MFVVSEPYPLVMKSMEVDYKGYFSKLTLADLSEIKFNPLSSEEDSIVIENITMVKFSVENTYPYAILGNHTVILSPNPFSIKFSCNIKDSPDKEVFNITIYYAYIEELQNKDYDDYDAKEPYLPRVKALLKYNHQSFYMRTRNQTIKQLISEKFLKVNSGIIKNFIENTINKGVLESYKSVEPFELSLNKYLFKGEKIHINLNTFVSFNYDPDQKRKSALYYYSGNLDGVPVNYNATTVPLEKENFTKFGKNENRKVKMFFNYDLVHSILEKITQKKLEYTMNNQTRIYNCEEEFIVKNIKKFFPGILVDDNYLFGIEFKLNEVKFNQGSSDIKANVDMNFVTIKEKEKIELGKAKVNFTFKIKIVRKGSQFNYCSFKISVKKASEETNEDLIKKIQELSNSYGKEICLLEGNFPLMKFIYYIEEVEVGKNGIYLKGEKVKEEKKEEL